MNSTPLLHYNQNVSSDDDFVANFVARHEVLETLLRRLRAIEPDDGGVHHILIGQRGMGKTSLLRRLAIAINRDPDLAGRYIPLSFREEQYNVLTLGDFWRNCGEALAEWAEATGRDDLAARLDEALPSKAWAGNDGSVEQFNSEMANLRRRAVLLVDNVDLILDTLTDDERWTLRRYLQARQGPIMIGAATQPLKESIDHDAPFYEFFQPHYLDPLDEHETEKCMRALAGRRGEHGQHVIEVLDRQPERLKTLHTLTGGNPRVLALIYRLLETAESEAAMADLNILLDQVTPFYKAKIEEYQTAQQRAVIDAIALHWDPVTTGTLSRITNITATTLSPLLIKLRKDGLIESTETSGSYAGHQIVERFFNIWYLMRHGTRRTKQRLRWLVGFLTSFYSSSELSEIAQRAKLKGFTKNWHIDYEFAFNEALARQTSAREDNDQHNIPKSTQAIKRRIENNERKSEDGANNNTLLKAQAWAQEAFKFWEDGNFARCRAALDKLLTRFGDAEEPALREQIAMALVNKGAALGRMGDHAAALAAYDTALARFGNAEEPALRGLVAVALVGKGAALEQMSDHAAAIAAYDAVLVRFGNTDESALREQIAMALLNKGAALGQMNDHAAAIAAYDAVLARFGNAEEPALHEQVAMALVNKGAALGQMGDHAAQVAAYDAVLARFGNAEEPALREQVAMAQLNKGAALGQMGDHAAAIAAYDAALARFGNAEEPALREQVARVLLSRGIALGQMGDHAAAIAAYDAVLVRFGNAEEPTLRGLVAVALVSKGIALGQMGDHAAAIAAYDAALARFGNAEEPALRGLVAVALLVSKGVALGQMGDHAAAIAAYDAALARFGNAEEPALRKQVARTLVNKGVALEKIGDHAAAISTYERACDFLNEEESEASSKTAAVVRIRLANLLLDFEGEIERAEALYKAAISFEPILAKSNLAWLYVLADRVRDALNVRKTLEEMPAYGLSLLNAAVELTQDNFGSATNHLTAALNGELEPGEMDFSDDFDRLLRLAERKGYGERLITWFEETGFAEKIAPIYVALKAYVRGEKILLDVNPEVRRPARTIYDRLDAPRRHKHGATQQKGNERKRRGRPRKA